MMPRSATTIVAERLRDALAAFGDDAEGALAQLSSLYDADVVFRDPLQTLRGREAFLEMNRRVANRTRRLAFDVTEMLAGVDSIFLAWTMLYEPRRGRALVFEGTTHARVQGGLITEQRDYWDLLSTIAKGLPLVDNLYSALAPRLA